MEKIDENPTISDEASFGLGSGGITADLALLAEPQKELKCYIIEYSFCYSLPRWRPPRLWRLHWRPMRRTPSSSS
jgi:hypothetical protein